VTTSSPRRAAADPDADRRRAVGGVPVDRPFLPAGGPPGASVTRASRPQGPGFFSSGGVPIVPLIEADGSRSESDASRNSSLTPSSPDAQQRGCAGSRFSLRGSCERRRCDPPRELASSICCSTECRGSPGDGLRACGSGAGVGWCRSGGGMDPAEVGARLEKRSGVLVRAGLHCSPNGHRPRTFPPGPCA